MGKSEREHIPLLLPMQISGPSPMQDAAEEEKYMMAAMTVKAGERWKMRVGGKKLCNKE